MRQGAGLLLRSQFSAQVGQNWIRNRQQPFRVATRAVTLWPQRGSCVATAGSEGQRTRWGSSGRAAVLARAAERAPRRARRPPVSKMGEQTVVSIHRYLCMGESVKRSSLGTETTLEPLRETGGLISLLSSPPSLFSLLSLLSCSTSEPR